MEDQEQLILTKEDYAEFYNSIVPEPSTYNASNRKYTQFIMFLSESKIDQEAYDYWIARIGTTDKIERKFLNEFVKYRILVRKAIAINNIRATMLTESNNII